LERLQLADPWLKLLRTDDASRTGWERDECAPTEQAEPDRLCGLRWRKAGGFAGLTTRLDEVSSRMKSGVFGERLGDVVEVELDSSPEIKFEWKFR
ncbi:MAG: hypothetical protein R3200_16975, partial [Xanthomonadales bacterium]|nr:hypothetical protein [Xanthomonadales bacterium]